jgi:hypothetical protein
VVRYNLTLYAGMVRIETDISGTFGTWNNWQGAFTASPMNMSVWPQRSVSTDILWQLFVPSVDVNAVQFRAHGELSVVDPADPFGLLNIATSNWYASPYVPNVLCEGGANSN